MSLYKVSPGIDVPKDVFFHGGMSTDYSLGAKLIFIANQQCRSTLEEQ
jgi:hypothetical protein